MKYNRQKWQRLYFKVGTLPGLHYFVATEDLPKLIVGGRLDLRADDGVTKPKWQQKQSILIEEIRSTAGRLLYVAQRF